MLHGLLVKDCSAGFGARRSSEPFFRWLLKLSADDRCCVRGGAAVYRNGVRIQDILWRMRLQHQQTQIRGNRMIELLQPDLAATWPKQECSAFVEFVKAYDHMF